MSLYRDLTGERFNKLVVIKRVENKVSPSGKREAQWLCKCDCGGETVVTTNHLKSGETKSCGCLCTGGQKGLIDITNQRFGKLVVIGRAKEDYIDPHGHHFAQWKTICDCGRETIVQGRYLRNGKTSCGICSLNDELQDQTTTGNNGRVIADLTGKAFNRLTVLGRGEDYISTTGQHFLRWKCLCSCGNTTLVPTRALLTGIRKSCGCIKSEPHPDRQKMNRYEERDDFMIGYTDRGRPFFFDKEDYDRVKEHCWCETTGGYIISRFPDGSLVKIHRFIMNAKTKEIVDHINHDVTDNRKINLRIVDGIHSMRNIGISVRNKSGIKGVYWRDGKWTASIKINKKEKYLGCFDDIKDAEAARKAAEEKYFGEHSYDQSIAAVPRIEGVAWAEPLPRYRKGNPVEVGADVMPADDVAFCDGIEPDAPIDITVAIDTIDPVPEFDVLPSDPVPEFEILPDLVPAL